MTENIAPELRRHTVAIDSIRPFDGNARRGDLELIRDSLRTNGQYKRLIVWDQTGEILVGNNTWQAAKDEGWQRIAVERISVPDRQRATAINLVDNRANDQAGWDEAALAAQLDQLDDLAGTGYTPPDVEQLLAATEHPDPTGGIQDPEPPPPPRRPVTRPGDLIDLAGHRLLCGDSTSRADVEQLMAGAQADLVFTSPPYNVGVKYRGKAKDDRMAGWDAYGGFLRRALDAWLPSVAHGRAVCWNIGTSADTFPARQELMLEEAGLDRVRQVVWDKVVAPMPLWYRFERDPKVRHWPCEYRHELILVYSTGKLERGPRVPEIDEAARRTVIELPPAPSTRDLPKGDHSSGSANKGLKRAYDKAHPAVFPVKLPRPFILHLAAPGELVVDPFAGAGTIAIAGEQLDRPTRMMEFDPAFCDVICQRFEQLTGTKPRRPKRQKGAKRR